MTDEQVKQIVEALQSIESKLGSLWGVIFALVLATYLVAFSTMCSATR